MNSSRKSVVDRIWRTIRSFSNPHLVAPVRVDVIVRIVHDVDGELGTGELAHVPRRFDWISIGGDTYQVYKVIWDLNQEPLSVEVIVQDPKH